jgi:hypothetical protein
MIKTPLGLKYLRGGMEEVVTQIMMANFIAKIFETVDLRGSCLGQVPNPDNQVPMETNAATMHSCQYLLVSTFWALEGSELLMSIAHTAS